MADFHDFNLPYEADWDGRNAGFPPPVPHDIPWVQDNANSFDLAQFNANPLADSTAFGKIPVRHEWFPGSYQYNGSNSEQHMDLIIHASQAKLVLPRLLGVCTGPKLGPQGDPIFARIMPVQDPNGWGMFATGIAGIRYVAPSGVIAREVYPDTFVLPDGSPNARNQMPDGGIYDNTMHPLYHYVDINDIDLNQALAKRWLYMAITVKFEHPRYAVIPDDFMEETYTGDERSRFMSSTWTPASEFVTTRGGFIRWIPYDCNKVDPSTNLKYPYSDVPLPPDADIIADATIDNFTKYKTVGTDYAYIRPTGEIKVSWYHLNSLVMSLALERWTGLLNRFTPDGTGCLQPSLTLAGVCQNDPGANLITNRYVGCVNEDCFALPYGETWMVFPPQTLLFLDPHLQEDLFITGFRRYNAECTFAYRAETWNKFLNPTANNIARGLQDLYWRAQYVSADGRSVTPIYKPVDFNRLFSF